jgi:hypothetical protein
MLNTAQKMVNQNSPAILTAIGVAGTITTAVLTHRAALRATDLIGQENVDRAVMNRPELTGREEFELVWKVYAAPVSSGCFTIASIVCANRIGTRRTAAMAAAYSLSERAFTEYREKVYEHVGKNKERKIKDEIAQDQVLRNPPRSDMIVVGSDVIFHEAFTGRYFRSNMEDVKQAVNRINHHMINNFSADLNDFYDFVGLDRTDMGDQLGWNSDKLIELEFTTIMDDQQRPAVSFRYANPPRESYFRSSM